VYYSVRRFVIYNAPAPIVANKSEDEPPVTFII
jgi:hypothetical protein